MDRSQAQRVVTSCFDSWYSALVRYAAGVLGSAASAEDLAQEAFLRLYRELRQGIEITNPKAWLFCVLRNEIGKLKRRQSREGPLAETGELVEPAPLPATADPADELETLFGVLTLREQEVVLLRLASLKYREIAERLGISGSAVNTLLARAVAKLRRATQEGGWKLHEDLANHLRQTLQ